MEIISFLPLHAPSPDGVNGAPQMGVVLVAEPLSVIGWITAKRLVLISPSAKEMVVLIKPWALNILGWHRTVNTAKGAEIVV